MKVCDFCRWEGEDVREFVFDPKGLTTCLCMACQATVAATAGAKTVGRLHPTQLVPILRAVVAQSVGTMLAAVITEYSKASGKEEFNTLVDMLKNSGSTDPN